MPFKPELMEDEDTDVVVRRHHRAHRRMALTIAAPVALVIALVVVWAMFSGPGCEQRFWKGFERPGKSSSVPKSWVVNPNSPTATLHITVSEPAKVWLDEKPIGKVEDTTIELTPGTHDVLTNTRRGGEMSTMLTVKAGEVFEVFFNRETRKIHLYRVGPNGEAIEVP